MTDRSPRKLGTRQFDPSGTFAVWIALDCCRPEAEVPVSSLSNRWRRSADAAGRVCECCDWADSGRRSNGRFRLGRSVVQGRGWARRGPNTLHLRRSRLPEPNVTIVVVLPLFEMTP